jgi:hypothetical protein
MKKWIFLFLILFLKQFNTANAQVAKNFNVKDCKGVSHDLFTELDSGNIVVLVWVMPCATCTEPAIASYIEVDDFRTKKSAKIKYYLVDDFANTDCSSLISWAKTNGIDAPDAVFVDAAIDMKVYGNLGMPKVLVLCGKTHEVIFQQDDALNVANFTKALDDALICKSTVGMEDIRVSNFNIIPNPISGSNITIDYNLNQDAETEFTIVNSLGQMVMESRTEYLSLSDHSLSFNNLNIKMGIYFLEIKQNNQRVKLKFVVTE